MAVEAGNRATDQKKKIVIPVIVIASNNSNKSKSKRKRKKTSKTLVAILPWKVDRGE